MEVIKHAVVSSVSEGFNLLRIKIGTSSWSNDKGQSVDEGWEELGQRGAKLGIVYLIVMEGNKRAEWQLQVRWYQFVIIVS